MTICHERKETLFDILRPLKVQAVALRKQFGSLIVFFPRTVLDFITGHGYLSSH